MGAKAIRAKMICNNEQRKLLWRTHEVFNQYISFVIQKMFEMKRGKAVPDDEAGKAYQVIFDSIKNSQNAIGKMEAVTSLDWKTGKTTRNADEEIEGGADRNKKARILARSYSTIQPLLESYELKIGDWLNVSNLDKWRTVFEKHPEIVGWKGGSKKLNPIDPKDIKKVERAKNPSTQKIKTKKEKSKKNKDRKDWREIELYYFLKVNPEIKELDKARKEYRWATMAQSLIKRRILLFDRGVHLPNLPSPYRRKMYEMAYQLISGHKELAKTWENDRKKWSKEKANWEKEHNDYMENWRPQFLAFEREVKGKITKRRRRWHLYLEWLSKNPGGIAGWRGKATGVNSISDEGKIRIDRASKWKKRSVEAEEFFKVNPELKAIDELHKEYEEKFVRGWVKKKNSDGFYHRPTFTMPSSERHPAWFTFQKDVAYSDLNIANGTVKLNILDSDDPAERQAYWESFRFKFDPRLNLFEQAEKKNIGRKSYSLLYRDYNLVQNGNPLNRPAEIRGIKLMFHPAQADGTPYLVFTCDISDLEESEKAKAVKWEEKETEEGKVINERFIPVGLVTCALDLGIHHMAVATIRRNGKIIRTRFIWDKDKGRNGLQSGASLKHIAKHKWELRKGLRERGKPIKGEESFIELRDHITSMGEDRFKKGARKIVSFAHNNGVDILILEKLEGLIPSAERERGINKALIQWNRGNLVKWIKQLAQDAGIRAIEVKQYRSSQVCSKCGSMGRRYTIVRNPEIKKLEVDFGEVKPLFGCPEDNCLLGVNSDFNASVNLHKIFYEESPFIYGTIDKKKDRIYIVKGQKISLDEVERRIQRRIEKKGLLGINESEIDVPY